MFVLLVIEAWGRVICSEFALGQVEPLCATFVSVNVPFKQSQGNFACFFNHLSDGFATAPILIKQSVCVGIVEVSESFDCFMHYYMSVISFNDMLKEGLDLFHVFWGVVHLSQTVADFVFK